MIINLIICHVDKRLKIAGIILALGMPQGLGTFPVTRDVLFVETPTFNNI